MDLRIDRLATLYFFTPIACASGSKQPLPILMYHSIADRDESQLNGYYRTTTSPGIFAKHMKYLHENGYRTISVAEASSRLQDEETQPPQKYAAITFDDGYSDFYKCAFPVLSRYAFTATMFLPTAYIGKNRAQFNGNDCLTWDEVRELRNHGISFGSHTVTHPQLRNLSVQAIREEIVSSKKAIEDNIGKSVDSFSYPYAFPEGDLPFTRMIRATLVACGYKQGVSTRIGTEHRGGDRYFLRRLPINSLDDLELFRAKLTGGYNWLHALQYGSKIIRQVRLSYD